MSRTMSRTMSKRYPTAAPTAPLVAREAPGMPWSVSGGDLPDINVWLALAVQEMFGMDPFCGAAFVFRAKRADRIKLLLWDQTGMVLVHKRLEGGKFVWPQVRDGVMRMSNAQFAALFEGVDWRMVRPERARRPLAAG